MKSLFNTSLDIKDKILTSELAFKELERSTKNLFNTSQPGDLSVFSVTYLFSLTLLYYREKFNSQTSKVLSQITYYRSSLINYVKTIDGITFDFLYCKLRSIDPHLVNEKRHNKKIFWITRKAYCLYYRVVRWKIGSGKIEMYQKQLNVITSLMALNKDAKKIMELFPKFFKTTRKTITLNEIQDVLEHCENDPILRDRKIWFKNYLKTHVNRDIDYLLDPHLSILVNPLLENMQSSYSNVSLGIASYAGGFTSASASVQFSKKSSLKDSVPCAVGMIDETASHMKAWRSVKPSKNVQMLPTNHCAHTNKWRKKLIRAAEHNIVISGNYCGGKAFDAILDLIKERLEDNSKLKVVIIAHPSFIQDHPKKQIRNGKTINELRNLYPERFSVVYSPDVTIDGGIDGFKKVTNHTKYTGIDWGRYYIMGGSAIKDNFDFSGVDDPFKIFKSEIRESFNMLYENLNRIKRNWNTTNENQMNQWIQDAKYLKNQLLRSPHYSPKDCKQLISNIERNIDLITEVKIIPPALRIKNEHTPVIDPGLYSTGSSFDSGMLGLIIPGNFRDMDFIFSDPNEGYSSGRQLFLEMTRLAYRWESLNEARKLNGAMTTFSPKQVSRLPIFTGKEELVATTNDSVIHRMMKQPIPPVSSLQTQEVEGFENAGTGTIEMIYQGPESSSGKSAIAIKALGLIQKAKTRIVFNHMYFAPTFEIMQALKEAAERGVKIEIITASATKNCPNSQLIFGPYNHWHWAHLAAIINPKDRHNLEIYVYTQKKKGLHKKVIVIDNAVLAGSSNFGYKSLVTSSDHEANFLAESESFAQKTLDICEEDKSLSKQIEDKTAISCIDYIKAMLYSCKKHLVN